MTSTQTVDIFSMLNKAQTEYNNREKGGQTSSVSAFFAQVSANANINDKQQSEVPVLPVGPPGVPIFQQFMNSHPVQVQQQQQTGPVNFVNIEQIEKQHVQPGGSNNVDIRNPHGVSDLANSPLATFLNSNNLNLNTLNNNIIPPGIRNVAPSPQMPFQSSQPQQPQDDHNQLNGNLLHQHQAELKAPVTKTISAPPGFAEHSNKPLRNLLKDNKPSPSLIPPTMFVSTTSAEQKATTPTGLKPEPLTKNQLIQALNYLIENDEEFMKKLHEAYLKSFNNMVTL